MDALFSQYTGFTGASALPDSYAVPSSHAAPSTGAKSFRATFSSRAEAEAVIAPLQGYLMKPGWEMSISVE
jgi:hypothetical protein